MVGQINLIYEMYPLELSSDKPQPKSLIESNSTDVEASAAQEIELFCPQ